MVWLRLVHAWIVWVVASMFEKEPLEKPTLDGVR